jgi:hypothetical protein
MSVHIGSIYIDQDARYKAFCTINSKANVCDGFFFVRKYKSGFTSVALKGMKQNGLAFVFQFTFHALNVCKVMPSKPNFTHLQSKHLA